MTINFRDATDDLLASISHEELAKVLGVSVPTVRQARLDPAAKAHRNPPDGWEAKVARLARAKAASLARLADRLS